jgi:CPA1 family monovalent cation:H+ antiporter
MALLDAAVASLGDRDDEPAARIRADYNAERATTVDGSCPRAASETTNLRLKTIIAQRNRLAKLRRTGQIDDDIFHSLEQELDWAELAASPPGRLEIVDG